MLERLAHVREIAPRRERISTPSNTRLVPWDHSTLPPPLLSCRQHLNRFSSFCTAQQWHFYGGCMPRAWPPEFRLAPGWPLTFHVQTLHVQNWDN